MRKKLFFLLVALAGTVPFIVIIVAVLMLPD
jgi:hypothetical protein